MAGIGGNFSMRVTNKHSRPISLPTLISALSFGIFVAGCSQAFEERFRLLWMALGAVGLIAAVVFEQADIIRERRRFQHQMTTDELNAEERMQQLLNQNRTVGAVP
jgi:hypothetical protein